MEQGLRRNETVWGGGMRPSAKVRWHGMDTWIPLLAFGGIFLIWLILQWIILPRLGIPT